MSLGTLSYPGAGIAHDGDQAVEEDHGHSEDKEQEQDNSNDGIVTFVEQVQISPSKHDGE